MDHALGVLGKFITFQAFMIILLTNASVAVERCRDSKVRLHQGFPVRRHDLSFGSAEVVARRELATADRHNSILAQALDKEHAAPRNDAGGKKKEREEELRFDGGNRKRRKVVFQLQGGSLDQILKRKIEELGAPL